MKPVDLNVLIYKAFEYRIFQRLSWTQLLILYIVLLYPGAMGT